MATTTTKIAGFSKTENTGITPKLARAMYDSLGSHHMAIVEFKASERTQGDDDAQTVKLEITSIEPCGVDELTDEHVRQLAQALYVRRNPQPALTTGDPSEPTVTAVLDRSGNLVMSCAECEHKYADETIAHTRGLSEHYPPCIWRACGHIVHAEEYEVCQKTHEELVDGDAS